MPNRDFRSNHCFLREFVASKIFGFMGCLLGAVIGYWECKAYSDSFFTIESIRERLMANMYRPNRSIDNKIGNKVG